MAERPSPESACNIAFDRLENFVCSELRGSFGYKGRWYWAPPEIYGWRHDNRQRFVTELGEELTNAGDKSSFVTSGLIGAAAAKSLENLTAF